MKNVKKVILGMAALGLSQMTLAAAPIESFEFPVEGATVSGILSVGGWAVGDPEVVSTQLFIDSDFTNPFDLAHGASRGDVQGAFPTLPDSAHAGFAGSYNTRLLSNGTHTLSVVATNSLGETTTQSITVDVSNAPGGESRNSVSLDFTNAQLQVLSPTRIALSRVRVNGEYETVAMEIDPVSHAFVINSFTHDTNRDGVIDHQGCANDVDCDGVDDIHDAFDDDANESADHDNNGVGDNDDGAEGHGDRDCLNDHDCDGRDDDRDNDDDNDGIDDDHDDHDDLDGNDDNHDQNCQNDRDCDGVNDDNDHDDDNDGIDDDHDNDNDNDR